MKRLSKATSQYDVEYAAFSTLDLDDTDWHAQLYRLCDSPEVRLTDVTIGHQHIRPMAFPEQIIWAKPKRGPRPGRGRGGRRGGRGRAVGGRGRGGGGDLALGDAEPSSDDTDVAISGSGGDSAAPADEGGGSVVGSSDEGDDNSETSSVAELIDKDLEAFEP